MAYFNADFIRRLGRAIANGQGFDLPLGGNNPLFQGHYGAKEPPFTPTFFPAAAKDLDAPDELWWYDGVKWE